MKVTFSLQGLEMRGEWNSEGKTLTLQDLSGTGRVSLGLLSIRGSLGLAGDNMVYLRPHGLIPLLETAVIRAVQAFSRRLAESLTIKGGRLMIDPNGLLPESAPVSIVLDGTKDSRESRVMLKDVTSRESRVASH